MVSVYAAVQSLYRRSLATTWRAVSTHFCPTVVLPTLSSPSASWRVRGGRRKSSHSCDAGFPKLRRVFRTRRKQFLRSRKSTAKMFASLVCTRRSMDQMHRSRTTGYYTVRFMDLIRWNNNDNNKVRQVQVQQQRWPHHARRRNMQTSTAVTFLSQLQLRPSVFSTLLPTAC